MKNDNLVQVDSLEIEALSDQELEAVAGGIADFTNVASCVCCADGSETTIKTAVGK